MSNNKYIPDKHSSLAIAGRMFYVNASTDESYAYGFDLRPRIDSELLPKSVERPWDTYRWEPGACRGATVGVKRTGRRTKWPDFMFMQSGGSYPLIVSARVSEALEDRRFESFYTAPVDFVDTREAPLTEAPPYVALCPTPAVDAVVRDDRENRSMPFSEYLQVPEHDGRPLQIYADKVSLNVLMPSRMGALCNREFVELAHEERWTNVHFAHVNLPQAVYVAPIDPLSETWPPEWRPPMPHEKSPEEWVEYAVALARAKHCASGCIPSELIGLAMWFHGQAIGDRITMLLSSDDYVQQWTAAFLIKWASDAGISSMGFSDDTVESASKIMTQSSLDAFHGINRC